MSFDDLTPDAERELAAIDAALEGRHVDPDLADLGGLAVLLREDRATADPAFLAELDQRVAAGFPRERRARSGGGERTASGGPLATFLAGLRTRVSNVGLVPALGVAASTIAVVVVGASVLSHDSGNGPSSNGGGTVAAQTATSPATRGSGAGGDTSPELAPLVPGSTTPRALKSDSAGSAAAPGAQAPAPATAARKVEHTVALTLTTKPANVARTADAVVAAATADRGIVQSSSVTSGDRGNAGASFVLRIPSNRLQHAIGALSKLGHVRSLNQNTLDITSTYRSARTRLQELLAERTSLLKRLAKATTDNETASLKTRIHLTNIQIDSARASLQRVNTRAAYSTVTVDIAADGTPAPVHHKTGGGAWGPKDALHDAGRVLAIGASVLLVSLAVLVPLGLLAWLAWLASRPLVRHRRERALDGV